MAARCPACSTLMSRRRVAAVEYDGCPACGGLWLDKGELQTLGKQPDQLRAAAANFKPGLQPAVAPARTDTCPRCEQALVKFEFDSYRGIRLDRCKQCGGVWMDHGEAEQFAEKLAPSQPAPAPSAVPAAPAYAAGIAPHLLPDGGAQYHAPDPYGARAADPSDATSTFGLPIVRGRAMAEISHGAGSFSRGLAFIKGAYGLALECPKLMVPMVVAGAGQLVVGMVALKWMRSTMRESGMDLSGPLRSQVQLVENWFQGREPMAIGVVVLGVFLIFLGNAVIRGMTVNLVDAWLKGREPRVAVAALDVVKNLGALVLMSFVSVAVSILTSRNSKGSFAVNAAKRAAQKAWEVLAALLVPIIIIEDVGFGRALARAKAIHSRGLLQIAVGEVGLQMVAGVLGLSVLALMGLLFWATLPPTPSSVSNILLLGLLVGTPINVVNAFARSAYDTCLYLWAAETERVGDSSRAVVPGPLASALR